MARVKGFKDKICCLFRRFISATSLQRAVVVPYYCSEIILNISISNKMKLKIFNKTVTITNTMRAQVRAVTDKA